MAKKSTHPKATAIGDIIGGMNSRYAAFKNDAVALRRKGFSYNEINKKIGVPKSTLSSWLKSVPLKPEHRKRLYTKQVQILSRGSQSQKERRRREIDSIVEEAIREIELPLSGQTFKLFGAALYWAEGSKTKSFTVTNSDPHLVAFMVSWFEKIFNVSPKTMKAYLNIYAQQNEKRIKRFWSDITGIPVDRFGKSYIKPLSTGYKKNNLYYGTIKVFVPKGTDMKHRLFGWIQATLQSTNPKVKLAQKKWVSLTSIQRPPVNL